RLVEDDRLGRDGGAGLLGVVDIIQADGDEIADRGDRRADARAPRHFRQALRIHFLELGNLAGRERRLVAVGEDAGKVAEAAIFIEDAGLLTALPTVAQQFHAVFSPSCWKRTR